MMRTKDIKEKLKDIQEFLLEEGLWKDLQRKEGRKRNLKRRKSE
jgi:hypothetical protein